MDITNTISILGGIASIIGLLSMIFFGQNTISKWFKKLSKRLKIIFLVTTTIGITCIVLLIIIINNQKRGIRRNVLAKEIGVDERTLEKIEKGEGWFFERTKKKISLFLSRI